MIEQCENDKIHEELQVLMTDLALKWQKKENKQQFLESYSLKINNFFEFFDAFEKDVKKPFNVEQLKKSSEHVLIIGPTGCGKSTVINYLIGNKLECVEVGRNSKPTIIKAIPKENNPEAAIGNNSTISKTDFITPYFNEETNVTYWDFPGFVDSRGETKRMRHAFRMKSFSEAIKKFKVLLVVEDSVVSQTNKGDNFMDLLDTLNQLCSADQIQNSLVLLITKCDQIISPQQRDEDKRSYVEHFSNLMKQHHKRNYVKFLELLSHDNMIQKIALFPKVNKGLIADDHFQDLNPAIKASHFTDIVFDLNIDKQTKETITTLTSLLNNYAVNITQEIANTEKEKVIQMIYEGFYGKEALSNYVKTLFISSDDVDQFVKDFKEIAGDENKSNIIDNIVKTLKFFKTITPNSLDNLSSWVKPFEKFGFASELTKTAIPVYTNLCKVMQIKVPVLYASKIKNLYEAPGPEISEIKAMSCLFIVDQNLNFPGINLCIASTEWNIRGDKEISLKGNYDEGIMHSGSFYGYAERITGGTITFDLDGVDGKDGKFDKSHIDGKIVELDNEIKILSAQLQAIEMIKNHMKEMSKKNKNQLENEYDTKNKIPDQLQEIVENLQELAKIQDDFKKIKKNSPLYSEKENLDIINAIKEVRNKINKIDKLLTVNIEEGQCFVKYKEINDILQKVKNISSSLNKCQYNTKYYELLQQLKTKYAIFINDTHLELSAEDLDDKCFGLKTIQKVYETSQKELKSEKEKYERQKKKIEKEIENWDKNCRTLNDNKELMDRKLDDLEQKKIKLQNTSHNEYNVLLEEIDKFKKVIENKDEATKALYAVICKKENITSSDSNNKFNPITRELLNPKNYNEFVKQFTEQKNNFEQKSHEIDKHVEIRDTISSLLSQVAEITTRKELFAIKKQINQTVNRCKFDDEYKYTLNNNEPKELKQKFNDTYRLLKKLCEQDDWFNDLRINNDDNLDKIVRVIEMDEQISVQNGSECYKQYEVDLTDAIKVYEEAIEKYENAEKAYNQWKKSNMGKDPMVDDYLQTYNEYLECEKNVTTSFNVQAKTVKQLLLNEVNMIERIELKWKDRNVSSKTGYVFKEMFLFNREYYEKYELSSLDGIPGGNSGKCEFNKKDDQHIKIKQKPGQGGHSFVLDGRYFNEYSFPLFKGIKEKTKTQENYDSHGSFPLISVAAGGAATVIKTVVPFLDDITVQVATKGATLGAGLTTAAITGGISAGIFVLQLGISGLVAKLRSHWVDGPYKTDRGKAEDGKNRAIDESKDKYNELQYEFSQYEQPEELKSFFSKINLPPENEIIVIHDNKM